jgi:hypothetical protein
MQCIVESEHTNTIVVKTIAIVDFSLWAEPGMKPSMSVLIYFYLTGQCISTLAKTNCTLDSIKSLVCLENSSNLESFETVSGITGSKSFGFHKGHNIAHTFDVAHSLTDNTV